jgi:uncharacterized membrane protein
MEVAMTSSGTLPRTPPPSRGGTVAAWTLAVLLALAMAGAGVTKLAADPAMVTMFDDIGTGTWMRVLVGACELAGAVGLLVPRLRSWAALGLLVLLVCATVTNVLVLDTGPLLSLVLAAVAATVLVLRRGELSMP